MFFKKRELEIKELEERILQLEKRIEDYKRKNNNSITDLKAQFDIYKEYTSNKINTLETKTNRLKKKCDKNDE